MAAKHTKGGTVLVPEQEMRVLVRLARLGLIRRQGEYWQYGDAIVRKFQRVLETVDGARADAREDARAYQQAQRAREAEHHERRQQRDRRHRELSRPDAQPGLSDE